MKIKTLNDASVEDGVITFIRGAFSYSPCGSRAMAVFLMNAIWNYSSHIKTAPADQIGNTPGTVGEYKQLANVVSDAMRHYIESPIISPDINLKGDNNNG